jgi:hypothetical protein
MFYAGAVLQVFRKPSGYLASQPVLSPFGLNKSNGKANQDE